MYALLDGNNFYVSCERAFRPALKQRAVVCLSNNDGNVIARSNEAKALGIRMGQPWFEVKHLEHESNVVALSANFTLYGDMSNRMMSIAREYAPSQEIYSIDECFLGMEGVRGDLVQRGHALRERVLQWTGVPCGVGIGSTKTLAKLANHVAKTADRKPGSYPAHLARVCNLAALSPTELQAVMQATPLGEVWGIGRRIATRLEEAGHSTVWDVARLDVPTVRRHFGVTVERTVRELQGQACIALEDNPAPRQQIAYTRSFGKPVSALPELMTALSSYAAATAVKLRSDGSVTSQILVFIHTSPHRPGPQLSRSITIPLPRPTAETMLIVKAACVGLKAIYKPGYNIIKGGVMLMDLAPNTRVQLELGIEESSTPGQTSARLMSALDTLNDRYGRGSLRIASEGVAKEKRQWAMRQERRTPHYTTNWADIPIVRA
jgi:DNA polymerase V